LVGSCLGGFLLYIPISPPLFPCLSRLYSITNLGGNEQPLSTSVSLKTDYSTISFSPPLISAFVSTMSSDGTNNSQANGSANRRGSVTSVAFSSLFQRNNSTSAGSGQARDSATAAAARDHRRRLSITTLGLSSTSPPSATSQFGLRRASVSTTTSDSIDENAVDDEETAKTMPNTPYTRHLSFGASAIRTMRPSPTSPGLNDNTYNWSEQLRSRAESTVAGSRHGFGASASSSPPRVSAHHNRTKSVSDMPAPPQQAAAMKPKQPERPKPDHFQERILKGDFYMD